SARFNDTWELALVRPSSQDILRRALYLVRQRRFLDMCFGIESENSASIAMGGVGSASNEIIAPLDPGGARAVEDFKASAIPSPNSSGLASSQANPPSPTAKRSTPQATDDEGSRGHKARYYQRQRKMVAADPASSSCLSLERSSTELKNNIGSATQQALIYLQHHIAPLINLNDLSECQSFHTLSTALFQIS
ncbi:hypothetical protein GGI22_007256, partial [Coemansia erecta]